MPETLKRHMLTRLKKKMTPALIQSRKNSQHQMVRDKYMIFSGSEENFVRNGAWVLEESIALFHGKANPVRYLSVVDLNNMNVEPLPCYGEGSCCLYQGSWEGRVVLVKKSCCDGSHYAECSLREIVIATQMASHKNAHKILGCCLETDLPVVVYEWMPPETLHYRIFLNDTNQRKAVLEWKDRLRIAWEISHVVAYLNTAFPRPIIHKHLKPSNVFLDQHNAAKLGDFSLSVSIPEDKEFVKDTVVSGTVGYIDPEYNNSAKVAKSTDVYSFGMLLLVLLTGKSPIFKEGLFEETRLDSWVQDRIENDSLNGIVDPAITRNEATSIQDIQLRAFAQLALRCITGQRDDRPTMVEVATELKNMITSPEFIPTATNFQENGLYRIFYGSEEYFTQNSALVHKESISLFNDSVHPIRYFSVNELNNMNVEFDRVFRYFYRGTWEGKAVLIRQSNYRDEIGSFREIVVATRLVTHNNVQKLLGCCLETELPVLVYEWVAAETLEDRILRKDENHCRLPPLEWKDRLRIAWEISDVVSYLQTAFPKPIIHKIFTLNNVFLDQDNTTKLFNLAECTTDVKSLGMLILVLLTGKYEVANLVNNRTLGDIIEIIDPTIVKNRVATTELRASIELALRCTNGHLHLGSRPIMEEIAIELNNIIRSHESIPSTSTFQE